MLPSSSWLNAALPCRTARRRTLTRPVPIPPVPLLPRALMTVVIVEDTGEVEAVAVAVAEATTGVPVVVGV